jgi:hypothetical protein
LDRVLLRRYRDPANRRLVNHLWRERLYLFTFLYCPGLEATNNAAERALRPLVVARKNWGGNRTDKGARAQVVLSSILASARQQRKNPLDVLIELLVSKDKNKILSLVPTSTRAPQYDSAAAMRESMPSAPPGSPSPYEGAVPLESVALYAAPGVVGSAPPAIPA